MQRVLPLQSSEILLRVLPRFLLLVLLFGTSCGRSFQPSPLALPPQSSPSSASTDINNKLASMALQTSISPMEYHIGPEDLLQITLFNVPDTEIGATPRKMEVRVGQQGTITLPLLGDIQAVGSTTSVLEQTLQDRYTKYLRHPQVGVFVKEYHSHQVSIIGEVKSPGVLNLTGPKTLIDILAMAGGLNEKASRQVHLYRQGPSGRESYVIDIYTLTHTPDAANFLVQTGDVVNVPQAGMVFITGAVKNPGGIPLNRPYTLTQAVSQVGGTDPELASTSGITILRRGGPTGVEALPPIDLNEIQSGKIADPVMQAEDVVYVPLSMAKYVVKHFIYGFSLGQLFY